MNDQYLRAKGIQLQPSLLLSSPYPHDKKQLLVPVSSLC